jgi:hypothetical protein
MQSELAWYDAVYHKLKNQLLRKYLLDSADIAGYSDSLVAIFLADSNITGLARAAFELANRGDSLQTIQLLSSMQNTIKPEDSAQFNLLVSYVQLLLQALSSSTGWAASDSLACILLENMEQTNYSQPGARARSVLRMKEHLAYHEPILLPGMGTPKQVMAMPEVTTGQDTAGSIMNLYPNPASTILTIEYKVEDEAGELMFQILDIKGSLIRSIPLANHKGKATIGLSGIPAGTFFGVLRMNGTLLQSKKFSVAK